ncbi:hypothetical protein EMPS_05874 [Entomortierella parvispora]|uniref:VWFA domain-containing protein n=1 Tax=Entomortierella parvispora TaxID=205924 RepID=A0A9P3HBG4_9FUNG|nr:hypothetical protein EMPS_05874 [Entomortierella parvispora]
MGSLESDNESLKSTSTGAAPTVGFCQAFHPLENDDKVTVLTLQLPPASVSSLTATEEEEKAIVQPVVKETFFNICLDVSGSMAGAALRCAKEAMKRLVDHLINNCGVPADRITIYLFAHTCRVRRLGGLDDIAWMDSITASGGTSFASVFRQVIAQTQTRIQEVSQDNADVASTLFFFTDGEDMDATNLSTAKNEFEQLLKETPRLESTVHSFGFTASHDAKLLGWLTNAGSESGCFQYIQELSAIETSMSKTLDLLGDLAMVQMRKIEIRDDETRGSTGDETEQGVSSQQVDNSWIPVKLEADGLTGSVVLRDRVFNGKTIQWREYQGGPPSGDDLVATASAAPVHEIEVEWLPEADGRRILSMANYIQPELLRLVERINQVNASTRTAEEKRSEMREIDAETEAYGKTLGIMSSTSVRLKNKVQRESCMIACQKTRSLLQSFLTLKADAHKQGSISNTSLATFNALAYGQINESKLKAKLDARAGKNMSLFAELDEKVSKIVQGLDLDKLEAETPEETLRELSCAFSTNSFVDALREEDCLCMTLDVSRSVSAIADPSQMVIKSIFPTYLTSSMFTMALGHSLATNTPENVHGGFDRNIDASIAPGLAHESITAVLPLYINEDHWKVARLRMKPIMGYVVTLDATGYTYSQSTTVPFLVLIKALESHPMTEFKQRQIQLILQTCDAIYRGSQSLRENTKKLVEGFVTSHTLRTVDVVNNVYVLIAHAICAVRAGDISIEEIRQWMPKLEVFMVEEQIRRDMTWKVTEDLMGDVKDWFGIDHQRDVYQPGVVYRQKYAAYTAALDRQGADAGAENVYRELFKKTRAEQNLRTTIEPKEAEAVIEAASALSIADEPLTAPEFEVPTFDCVAWKMSKDSLDRLGKIQGAVSHGVDKICRLLNVAHSPMDDVLFSEVLPTRLGTKPPFQLADEFFAKYSPKIRLATLLQSFAHTKNSDRRSAEDLMTPFEHTLSEGEETLGDSEDDEAIQFLSSIQQGKMYQMINEVVVQAESDYLESRKNATVGIFLRTDDPYVAAGILIESKFRGGAGGRLVTACAQLSMQLPKIKIQMLVNGTHEGVQLFSDSVASSRWYPCKRTLYRMFRNHHDAFSLEEWRGMHPNKYEDYVSCRYVFDGCKGELTLEEQQLVEECFRRKYGDRRVVA